MPEALGEDGGNLASARDCARRNIEVFERHALDAIIINAAGCGSTLKEYGQLLRDDPAWAERGRKFSATVKDLTEWLTEAQFRVPSSESRAVTDSALRAPRSAFRVTYHDACHLAHPQHVTKQPPEPEMAERLQRRKIENILKTGAQMVVTTNPGCILQIRAGLKKAGANIEVLHIADFLAQALDRDATLVKVARIPTPQLRTQ